MVENIIITVCFLIVFASCVAHVTSTDESNSHCEKIGFSVTLAASLAKVAETWAPKWDWFYADTSLGIGLALIVLSMDRERVRSMLSRTYTRLKAWDGRTERRRA